MNYLKQDDQLTMTEALWRPTTLGMARLECPRSQLGMTQVVKPYICDSIIEKHQRVNGSHDTGLSQLVYLLSIYTEHTEHFNRVLSEDGGRSPQTSRRLTELDSRPNDADLA